MFVGIVPSNIDDPPFCSWQTNRFSLDLGVYLVGSSANGFATEDTDADICIVISPYTVTRPTYCFDSSVLCLP